MKRTSFLDLNTMRKRTRSFVLAPLSLAVMVGCSSDNSETVKFVESIDDCTANTALTFDECKAAYEQALLDAQATAPRYRYERDCQNEFGSCEERGGFFVPFMAGFIVSEIIGKVGDAYESKHRYKHSYPTYLYRGGDEFRNKYMTTDGMVIGSPGQNSYRVNRDVLKPKPKVTRTISRGGFGSAASAKSNWGSAKSKGSSSKGWGG